MTSNKRKNWSPLHDTPTCIKAKTMKILNEAALKYEPTEIINSETLIVNQTNTSFRKIHFIKSKKILLHVDSSASKSAWFIIAV